jgi:DNA-binding NtrC family response regulator
MGLRTRKVMIVCCEVDGALESRFIRAGWAVIWVYDARTAITRVRRERFDLVVLLSTGDEMDIIETYFNLQDIRKTLPVVVVRQAGGTATAVTGDARELPDSGLRAVQSLDGLFSLLSNEKIPGLAAGG